MTAATRNASTHMMGAQRSRPWRRRPVTAIHNGKAETCASCRGAALYGVTRPDGTGLTTTCWHVGPWVRRLSENAQLGDPS